jgi:uncharacterized protein YodC (DUF2158 family)
MKNNLQIGDRVKLRGRSPKGIISKISSNTWVRVVWDIGSEGPRFVDIRELEKEL